MTDAQCYVLLISIAIGAFSYTDAFLRMVRYQLIFYLI